MSRRLAVNPVLSRELRQRVHSRRATVVLTVYLSLLVAAVGLLVWGIQKANTVDATVSQGIGRTLFGTLLFGILGLVCFIVPGVAAGAVAGERERLTLVPLQVTLLTPGQLLRGKLLASLAFTSLLLVATLPLLAVAYVLGGVTVPQIAGGLFLVLASAAFLGVISIWASTVLRRVQRATVVAYGMVGLLVVGTPIAYGVQFVVTTRPGEDSDSRRESLLLVAPNPFLVTADALGHDSDSAGASPFTPSQAALRRRDERRRGTGGFVARVEERFALDAGEQMAPPAFGNAVPATVAPGPIPVPTTAIASGVPPGFGGDVTSSAPILPTPPAAPFPQRGPVAFDPSTGMAVDPSTGRPVDPSAGVDFGAPPEVFPARSGGDFTDRGPIWAWSFGWWALLGGAAYLHAARKLRLPSAAGVRP